MIWLKSRGKLTSAICDATGYKEAWVRELIHRYNDKGPKGLCDRRRLHPGSAPMLDEDQQQELAELLGEGTAPDGGPCDGPKVARWIQEKTGREHVLGPTRLGLPDSSRIYGPSAPAASPEDFPKRAGSF